MNILKRYRLKKQKKALMRKYAIYEQLQTEHSGDEHFYRCTQNRSDCNRDICTFKNRFAHIITALLSCCQFICNHLDLRFQHSGDEHFYRCTQKEMDALDSEAEHIRGILEGRWKKWQVQKFLKIICCSLSSLGFSALHHKRYLSFQVLLHLGQHQRYTLHGSRIKYIFCLLWLSMKRVCHHAPGIGIVPYKSYKPIYGSLQAINKAIAEGKPIFIPEGEKDADTLIKQGYTAFAYGGTLHKLHISSFSLVKR